jgi:cold shock CspA family protein
LIVGSPQDISCGGVLRHLAVKERRKMQTSTANCANRAIACGFVTPEVSDKDLLAHFLKVQELFRSLVRDQRVAPILKRGAMHRLEAKPLAAG